MRRLWLDANVILRFLTADNEALHARAVALIARADAGEVELVLDDLILAEVIWVLRSFYEYPMAQITDVIVEFLLNPGIVANKDLAVRSLKLARDKNVHFVDAYLALRAAAAGEEVRTFDKTDFARLPVQWSEPS